MKNWKKRSELLKAILSDSTALKLILNLIEEVMPGVGFAKKSVAIRQKVWLYIQWKAPLLYGFDGWEFSKNAGCSAIVFAHPLCHGKFTAILYLQQIDRDQPNNQIRWCASCRLTMTLELEKSVPQESKIFRSGIVVTAAKQMHEIWRRDWICCGLLSLGLCKMETGVPVGFCCFWSLSQQKLVWIHR